MRAVSDAILDLSCHVSDAIIGWVVRNSILRVSDSETAEDASNVEAIGTLSDVDPVISAAVIAVDVAINSAVRIDEKAVCVDVVKYTADKTHLHDSTTSKQSCYSNRK